jgi:hypothetical protein
MIVQGSMNYTTCGRKMSNSKSRRKRRSQVWHTQTKVTLNYREPETKYPSVELGPPRPEETGKKEYYIGSHTIAPAYNKGAYQVISKDNIKDIGR